MKPPLLTVAIPTRNRSDLLLVLVDELLRSVRQDFEIVIQDNSDTDSLRDELSRRGDPRVHYDFEQSRISVVENCDRAVGAAQGGFVCMLGDDDGILLEESLDLVDYCLASGIDAVVPGAYYYAWPSVVHKVWGNVGGRLYEASLNGALRHMQTEIELRSVLTRGGALGLGRLPRVYHGFVSRRALNRVKEVAGTYFPGPSPDMANAIAVSAVLASYVCVDFPYILMGHSRSSAGGLGAEKKHRGNVAAQAHLPADTVSTWHAAIPFFWSGPTIYAQSVHRAAQAMWGPRAPQLHHAWLYAACLVYERYAASEIWSAMKKSGEALPALCTKVAWHASALLFRRAVTYLRNLWIHRFGRRSNEPVATIAAAIQLARQRVAGQGLKARLVEGSS
jgi:hypothetical protein